MHIKESVPTFMLLATFLLFGWSLTLPVWECGNRGTRLDGASVLMMGYMGLLYLDPRWFCNIIFIYAASCVFNKNQMPNILLVTILAVSGSTALIGPYFCGGSGSLEKGTAIASGGIVWVLALWAAFATVYFCERKVSP